MEDPDLQIRMVFLGALLEHSPIHMALLDPELRFIEVNEHVAANHGLSAADHVGRSLREVVGDVIAPVLEAPIRKVLATGEPLSGDEIAGVFPTGEKVVRTNYYPATRDGELIGVAVVGLEVTEERRETQRHRAEAQHTSAEYRRALRDYTQLTRHRLANPLTALTGRVTTLIDLDESLDSTTRMQVLKAMRETAQRLEQAVLHPELLSGEESKLRPVRELSERAIAEFVQVDAVKAERHFREINEAVIEQAASVDDRQLDLFCECWAMGCTSRVRLPVREYLEIHEREDQFVVCPEHVLATVEDVVHRSDGHSVVRKSRQAIAAAEQADGHGV